MFLKKATLAALAMGAILTGCSASDTGEKPAQAQASTSTGSPKPAQTEDIVGDTDEEVAVAAKWADKWCAVHMGEHKSQAIAAMGAPRKAFSGDDVLLWSDKDYQFQVNLDKKGIVVGHGSGLPSPATDEVDELFTCGH